MTKRYDTARTPYQRTLADPQVTKKAKQKLTRQYETLNPAQIRRDLTALESLLLQHVKAKHPPARLPVKPPPATRAPTHEATKNRSRAS